MIKLINGWTKEKVMEQVKKYNNGKRAFQQDCFYGSCVYEAYDGNRCAIGCFIPDNHDSLTSRFIGQASDLITRYPDLTPLMPFDKVDLHRFQEVHDMTQRKDSVHKNIENFLNTVVE